MSKVKKIPVDPTFKSKEWNKIDIMARMMSVKRKGGKNEKR